MNPVPAVWRFVLVLWVSCLFISTARELPAQPSLGSLVGMTNSVWSYWTNGPALPGWAEPGFDAGTWPTGRGLFGNDENAGYAYPMATEVIGPGQFGPLTVYYRTRFQVALPHAVTELIGTAHVDDGCVLYLNGMEIARYNMPAEPPGHTTAALAANPGGEPVAVPLRFQLSALTNGLPNPLVAGENVLAVEVHQNAPSSSDHVFGLSLSTSHGDCLPHNLELADRTVPACGSTTFALGPQFCPSTFQWFANTGSGSGSGDEPIVGATESSLILTSVRPSDSGEYYCVLTTALGTVTTRHARLQVVPDETPPRVVIASAPDAAAAEFRIRFNQALPLTSAEPGRWGISSQAWGATELIDVPMRAGHLTNGNEVVLFGVESRRPGYSYRYAGIEAVRGLCGEGVLAAGFGGTFLTGVPLPELTIGSPWHYETRGQDDTLLTGVPWFAPGFDDSSWPMGRAPLGTETTPVTLARLPGGILTSLPLLGSEPAAAYFRSRVRIPAAPEGHTLIWCHSVDDGAAFYIDGHLVARHNLSYPAPIPSSVRADGVAPGDGDASVVCIPLNLAPGEYLLAAEVHQAAEHGDDLVFGTELRWVETPGPLKIAPSAAHLEWIANPWWSLMQSPNAGGPWSVVPGDPVSPYSLSAPDQARFYRLGFRP